MKVSVKYRDFGKKHVLTNVWLLGNFEGTINHVRRQPVLVREGTVTKGKQLRPFVKVSKSSTV